MTQENLDLHLDVLQDMDLIYESKAFPEREYTFKNAFTQEVAYNGLLMKTRKEVPLEVAEVIENLYSGRIEEYYEILAYHYSRAEAYQQASRYLLEAGLKAKNLYANEEAINYFQETVSIQEKGSEKDDGKLRATYEGLGDVYELIGDYANAVENFTKAASVDESARATCEAFWKIGRIHEKRGEREEAMAYYEKASAGLGQDDRSVEAARLFMNKGWLYGRNSEYDPAADYCQRALEILENSDYLADLAQAHNNLAVLYEFSGHWDKAYEHNSMSIEIMEKIGDKRKLGSFYASIGLLSWKRGDLNQTGNHFKQNFALMEQIGNVYGIGGDCLNLAQVKCDQDRLAESEELALKALEIHRDLKVEGRLCSNLRLMSEIFMKKGNLTEAESCLDEARELARKNNYKFDLAMIDNGRGSLEALKGNDPSPHFQDSIDTLTHLNRKYELGSVFRNFGCYKIDAGYTEEGNRYLNQSDAIFSDLGVSF